MNFINVKDTAIPALGFGTLYLDDNTALRMVGAALAEGYTHIDTAQIYQNEAAVGSGIKASGIARDKIFLTTKVWFDKFTKKDFLPSVEESLQKLKTDYVDLLLIHWPNPDIPLEETVEQLVLAREKGYTKHIGVSNFPIKLVEQTLALGADIVTNQVEYHPLIDQTKLQNYLRSKGIALTAYSPIAQGEIIGNQLLKEIGEKYGKNEIQVTLRWMMQQQDVLAIPRTSSEANLKSNFQIFDFELTPDDVAQIDTLRAQNRRVVTPDFSPAWD
ncbi:aldo/keto reductase [Pontibacter qinzhouensis]|uniref:Aldo/keto reductase n=1 Tax=Pontibacter qinzhouensis TaxID=2603253 RepID=A0A5C8JL71_9BACT|nr:aldo/keto reductase [Pontibacter qinzhouensis]TXK37786.1 aldo/keto reductase [Pontibacter qinzhouensis]